ncbi:MAG: hypothetical protein GYB68_09720 [Chloroflexi bacterium]|nr:hypothetical protein [Chloroflexota bacterium]
MATVRTRWGLMLDTLARLSDTEQQLVAQGAAPADFVPDRLLDDWFETFQDGAGLTRAGISPAIITVLDEFDANLVQLIDVVPDDIADKEGYIQYDEVWRVICEMADWTLTRIAAVSQPREVTFSLN